MLLTFDLPDGTRAGIRPTHELEDLTIEQLELDCLAPASDASVVFHVSNQEALHRIRERFALPGKGAC
jgi:hypothetical protein